MLDQIQRPRFVPESSAPPTPVRGPIRRPAPSTRAVQLACGSDCACATCAAEKPPALQRAGASGETSAVVLRAAEQGLAGSGERLPHLDRIQRSFGPEHDLSGVQAHLGPAASAASRSIGADAYTRGEHVAFRGTPTLRLAAHEAAHVVQQRRGVSLAGGVGESGDSYERAADAAADRVAAGESAAPLVGPARGAAPGAAQAGAVQRFDSGKKTADLSEDELLSESTNTQRWLAEHSFVDVDYVSVEAYAKALTAEIGRRRSSHAPAPPGIRTGGATANSLVQAWDANVRISEYVEPAERLARQIFKDMEEGKIPHLEARQAAVEGRNALLGETRSKLSPGGRAFSKGIKEEGKTLPDLIAKYGAKVLTENPELMNKYGLKTLDKAASGFDAVKYEAALKDLSETAEVSREIIKAAGRSSKVVTAVARFSRVAGPVGLVIGGGISTYEVITAPEGQHLHVAGREASGFAGGMLGSVGGGLAAGWVASLACGPGAPVCALVISVTIVGAASYAGGKVGEEAFEAVTAEKGGGGAGGAPSGGPGADGSGGG